MLNYVVTRRYANTIFDYLKSDLCGSLQHRVNVLYYDDLHKRLSYPKGAYIFSDVERLTLAQTEAALRAYQSIKRATPEVAILNHPYSSMRRYELLRTLYEKGINNFDTYRLNEARMPKRYPVFIRAEDSHRGPLSKLLNNFEELRSEINAMSASGSTPKENKIITEFCNTADDKGMFVCFRAYVIGNEIIPYERGHSPDWVTKCNLDFSEKWHEVTRKYMTENPHADELLSIAQMANISYGRFDYALLDGKIQIWELNTNPTIPAGFRFADIDRQPWSDISKKILKQFYRTIEKSFSQLPGALDDHSPAGISAENKLKALSNYLPSPVYHFAYKLYRLHKARQTSG